MISESNILKALTGRAVRRCRDFASQAEGNVAMMFALSILPILIMVGGAVDFSRATTSKQSLQIVLDNAVLAATNLSNIDDPEEVIEDFVNGNLKSNLTADVDLKIDVEEFVNGRKISAEAVLPVNTTLLNIIGRKTINVGANSTASQYVLNTEISLALDVSSSMRGSRIRKPQSRRC